MGAFINQLLYCCTGTIDNTTWLKVTEGFLACINHPAVIVLFQNSIGNSAGL
jgi:hypothetical protein